MWRLGIIGDQLLKYDQLSLRILEKPQNMDVMNNDIDNHTENAVTHDDDHNSNA